MGSPIYNQVKKLKNQIKSFIGCWEETWELIGPYKEKKKRLVSDGLEEDKK